MNSKYVKSAALTLALLAGTVCAQEMREVSFYTASPVKGAAPVIDGDLGDECWKGAEKIGKYYQYVYFANPKRVDGEIPTEAYLLYDDKGVYCGVRNWDDRPEKLCRTVTKSNQGQGLCWNDCAEIYFDPDAGGVGYYKFAVNANGCWDLLYRMDAANSFEAYRIPGVQCAAKVFADRWEIELFVPFSSMHGRDAAKAGDLWTFNHCRFRFTHGKSDFITSSPGGSNYTPNKFGYLLFSDGSKPDTKKILDLISARLNEVWAIQIGDKTYRHDPTGILEMNESVVDYVARVKAEETRYNALCETNMMHLGESGFKAEPIKLPLAGTYDFSEPKTYHGYNGWYRHNRPQNGYRTPHLDWLACAAEKTPKVCFMTSDGSRFREACEIADRFPLEPLYFPGGFGAEGIYEDAVTLGRPLDKRRQFESLLAKDPDVFLVDGWPRYEWDKVIPAKYRFEILRRVADEGKGLIFFDSVPGSIRKKLEKFGLKRNHRGPVDAAFGKGRVLSLESGGIKRGLWTPEWKAAFEAHTVRCWNAIRRARGLEPIGEIAYVDPAVKTEEVSATARFFPFTFANRDGKTAQLKARVRNAWNETVYETVFKVGDGETLLSVPVAKLPGGRYHLDLVALDAKGAGDRIESHDFVKQGLLGAIALDGTNAVSFVADGKSRWAALKWEKRLDRNCRLEWLLRDLPYRSVREKGAADLNRGANSANVAQLKHPFPTHAGLLEARIVDADGTVLADERKLISFPNHRYEDYTMISWDGPNAGGLGELYAPITCEALGYKTGLNEGGHPFNFATVAGHAHVRYATGKKGETKWSTLKGFCTSWSDKRVDALGDEITPYDTNVVALVEEYYGKYVANQSRFSTHAWNLGDECSFRHEGGYGPKDRPFYEKSLERRYGTIANYNRVHATNLTSFAEAPNRRLREALDAQDWASWYDHVAFMEEMYAETYQLFHRIVKRIDPKGRVGAEGSSAGDLELTVKDLEFWGPYRSLVNDEFLRCLKPELLRGIWWGGYFDNLREGFPYQQWEFVLTGTLNADLWFQADPGSTQGYAGGDFTIAPYMAKMQPYLKPLRRGIAQLLIKTPFRNDGAALWYSHVSRTLCPHDERFSPPGDSENAYVRYCYRHGYDVAFVSRRHTEWLKGKKLVFLPGVTSMDDKEVAALLAWVKAGGIVVADRTPAVLDGFAAKRAANPLAELFGDVTLDKTAVYDASAADVAKIERRKVGKGEAVLLGFSLSALELKSKKEYAELMDGFFAQAKVSVPEKIAAPGGVFRVRKLGDMTLAGYKTNAKGLGGKFALDFGSEGYVYEVDKGFVGKQAKVEIEKLDIPFKLYAHFKEEQHAPVFHYSQLGHSLAVARTVSSEGKTTTAVQPSTSNLQPSTYAQGDWVTVSTRELRRGGVYRLSFVSPKGKTLEERDRVFTADGADFKVQFAYDDQIGEWRLVMRDIATGLDGTLKVKLVKELVKPIQAQLDYLRRGVVGLVHYGLNTYADREWGYGDDDPKLFNPSALDCSQWVKAAKAGGLKSILLVSKHHDGFCLWPFALNADYTVANSPWKDGKGNVVKEFADACRRERMGFGIYVSPWDRHQAEYARPAYVEHYHAQWDDILANYGEISEIWLDGANGGDGWYGGAKETRKIPKNYYRLEEITKKLFERNPRCVAFGCPGAHGIRWCGNESGFVKEDTKPCEGDCWRAVEADTPLRSAWFWHPNDAPKALADLADDYLRSVGNGGVLDLGLAPNREGLLDEADVKRLAEFGEWQKKFNESDVSKGAWKGKDSPTTYTIRLGKDAKKFDCADFGERIENGARVEGWRLEVKTEATNDVWTTVARGKYIGFRRIARFKAVAAYEARLVIEKSIGEFEPTGMTLRVVPAVPAAHAEDGIAYLPETEIHRGFPPEADFISFQSKNEWGKNITVKGFTYFPPKDGAGSVVDRWIYEKKDPKAWKWYKVAEGEFGNMKANPVKQTVTLPEPCVHPWQRIRALRAVDGKSAVFKVDAVSVF